MKIFRPLHTPLGNTGVVTALAWRWMYNADYRILNSILVQLGVLEEYHGWLVEPSTAMLSALQGRVEGFPFYMLMLFARLQGILRAL